MNSVGAVVAEHRSVSTPTKEAVLGIRLRLGVVTDKALVRTLPGRAVSVIVCGGVVLEHLHEIIEHRVDRVGEAQPSSPSTTTPAAQRSASSTTTPCRCLWVHLEE